MRVTKITATGMSRTPTVQYGYVEKHFTFEALMEEGEDKGLATDILNRMIARAFGADKPVGAAAILAAVEAEIAVEPVQEQEAAPAVETISAEDFGRTLAEYAKANGATKVLELRSKYGVATVAQLPAEKRAEFLADLQA